MNIGENSKDIFYARKESDDENHYNYAVKLMIGDENELTLIQNNLRRLRNEINSKRIEFKKLGGVKIKSSFEETQIEILKQNYMEHIHNNKDFSNYFE